MSQKKKNKRNTKTLIPKEFQKRLDLEKKKKYDNGKKCDSSYSESQGYDEGIILDEVDLEMLRQINEVGE